MAEYDGAGALLRRLIPGPGIDDKVAVIDASGAVSYFHTDRLGSVVAVSNGAGAASETYAYSPYGESANAVTGNPWRYTGRYLDAETGLYYYRARYYAPRLGQFLQTDPIGSKDDPNLTMYVGLDPGNATDPSGEQSADLLGNMIKWELASPRQKAEQPTIGNSAVRDNTAPAPDPNIKVTATAGVNGTVVVPGTTRMEQKAVGRYSSSSGEAGTYLRDSSGNSTDITGSATMGVAEVGVIFGGPEVLSGDSKTISMNAAEGLGGVSLNQTLNEDNELIGIGISVNVGVGPDLGVSATNDTTTIVPDEKPK